MGTQKMPDSDTRMEPRLSSDPPTNGLDALAMAGNLAEIANRDAQRAMAEHALSTDELDEESDEDAKIAEWLAQQEKLPCGCPATSKHGHISSCGRAPVAKSLAAALLKQEADAQKKIKADEALASILPALEIENPRQRQLSKLCVPRSALRVRM